MLLKDYIKVKKELGETNFSGISFDSSKIKKDYIFFAIKGDKLDGNDYVEKAIKKGAKIIITEKKNLKKKNKILFLFSSNIRKLLAEVSYKIFKEKPKKLVAVTGTNGKSSVSDFYFQILKLNSKRVASIGTLGVKYDNRKKFLTNTTLDPIKLGFLLNDLKKKKIEFLIMEASSHGLKQHRLDGLSFDIGIFTNFSHDHLDYHKNMNDYLKSKLYLFDRLIKKRGNIITDRNIPQCNELKKISIKRNIDLSLIHDYKNGIEIISHEFFNEKQHLRISYKKKIYFVKLNLIGKIQIKNILMAILAANKSGLKFRKIINVLNKVKPVEGRLEKIGNIKNNSKVILDYAHTPAALDVVLSNIKEQFPNRGISLVFGCGGNRDYKKRSVMAKIAEKYSDRVYLTDDNPRNENPSKIRKDIKSGFKKIKIKEISSRINAINEAIKDLNTGEVLLVAGKGHEKFQDYGNKKLFFSDEKIIKESIKIKNKLLSKDLRINIIKEGTKSKISNKIIINNISINSKKLKKNDAFFAIKGKRHDGNRFVSEAFRKKTSLAIVNKINKVYPLKKQIKVKNSLSFLTKCSSIFRENIGAKVISITGSCGKTTLKEMIGFTLKKISKTTYSPKSFNNKYGVPLSLLNLKINDEFGVFEVGMDTKGEIDNLTKIIKPDLGIITNISYAHSKNFENIKQIAKAKAEIMNNIKKRGIIVLNGDDKFFSFHKNLALKKKLRVVSFGIDNLSSMTKLIKIKSMNNKYKLSISINGSSVSFYSQNTYRSNLYNILATLTVINIYKDIKKLKKDIFLNFNPPSGRGDISRVRFNSKNFFLIDETYNSNPLSLKTAIENYDKIDSKKCNKYLILGDMLELGKHSLKQHEQISSIVNRTNINKVYVIGKYIKHTFKGIKQEKKARILNNKVNIFDLINKNFKNNDYLMIKGSNSTGLHQIASHLKKRSSYVI